MTAAPEMTEIVLDRAGGPERLTLQRRKMPAPGPGQLLVRTEAAGAAFNDITSRRGLNPGRLPRVIGFDAVGRVVAVGDGVSGMEEGQRVAALLGTGGYASHIVVDADRAVPVPSDLDPALLDALVLNYLTAWQLLHRVADVRPGQSILVLGAAGGVGSALSELARLDGLEVFGTSSAGRREVVEAGGARWLAESTDLPTRADVVFDSVGGPSLRSSCRAARPGGIVVSYGFSFAVGAGHSRYAGLVRTATALLRAKLVPGPRVRLYRVEESARKDPGAYRQDLAGLVALLARGRIHPAVTTMPLSQAADAHRRLEGRQVAGKIVLVPDDPA